MKLIKSNSEVLFVVKAAVAVFITYLSMYAFRKPFTSALYADYVLWGVDYKILLIITQLVGYTVSKYFGIKIISELSASKRTRTLVFLIAFSWLALLFLGLCPHPTTCPLCF